MELSIKQKPIVFIQNTLVIVVVTQDSAKPSGYIAMDILRIEYMTNPPDLELAT